MRSLLIICFLAQLLNAAQEIKIGVDLCLTSAGAADATDLRNTLLIRADELNARPKAPYIYRLIFEDNQETSRGAVLAAQKLLNVDKVDALITVFDYAIAPTVPLGRNAGVASIGLGWGATLVDGQYSFLFGCSEISTGDRLGDYLVTSPDKRVTIVAARQAAVPSIVSTMEKRYRAAKLPPPAVIWFNRDDMDFRTLLLRVKETNPDRLVLIAWDSDFKRIMYQLGQLSDFKPELLGWGFSFRNAEYRQQTVGAVLVAPNDFPAALAQKFVARYHRKMAHDYAPFAYDSLLLLSESLEGSAAKNLPVRERIVEALRSTREFEGITGSYQQENGVFDTKANLYRVTEKGEEMLRF